jgi:HEAT repeat protein
MPKETAEKRRIERHITNLNSPEEKVSSRAEVYLIRYYGSRASKPLMEACHHPNPIVRFRAVWALGYTHDPQAYETILHLTDDPEENVRYDATIALGILGDERAIEILTQLFLSNDATRPAADALSRMGIKVVPALMVALDQGNSHVRWSALQVLGNFAKDFGDERCIELLQAYANDPEHEVRENATFWLDEIREVAPQVFI